MICKICKRQFTSDNPCQTLCARCELDYLQWAFETSADRYVKKVREFVYLKLSLQERAALAAFWMTAEAAIKDYIEKVNEIVYPELLKEEQNNGN